MRRHLLLLEAVEASHWHRIDAMAISHFYRDAPLSLSRAEDGGAVMHQVPGSGLLADQHPQVVAPKGVWQAARSFGAYTLLGCTVAPGFEFSGVELAPPSWTPSG